MVSESVENGSSVDGVRPPTQRRGHDALEKLLTAASELVAERGSDDFTLSEVSKRAGISYGSMYWRVESKDALLHAVQERFDREVEAGLLRFEEPEQWLGLDLFQTLDKALRTLADLYDQNPALLRALSLRSGTDSEMSVRSTATVHRSAQAFSQVMVPRLQQAGHPQPERIIAHLYTTISGAMTARITWPGYHLGPEFPWSNFVDELCVMAQAQIQASLNTLN